MGIGTSTSNDTHKMAPNSSKRNKLQEWFPHMKHPFIFSAPMFLTATAPLAVAVTKAGGLGFIGAGFDFTEGSDQVANLAQELETALTLLGLEEENAALPVGIGALTFNASGRQIVEALNPLLQKYRPVCVWLFAPAQNETHAFAVSKFKELGRGWNLKVFVQAGTIAAAREAVQQGCDGISAQGNDAGGHQWAKGSSIFTFVPEMRDMFDREFPDHEVVLLAAGGVCDGRGVAASMALGADGAVMGTRFVCSEEALGDYKLKQELVNLQDGGVSTTKSPVFDDILFTLLGLPESRFPSQYDARAVKSKWFSEDPNEAKSRFMLENEGNFSPVVLA